MSFAELGLVEPLQRAVQAAGYTTPTPIQAKAIPPLLQGRDLLGCARTGTGKTAAFALPILHRLADAPAPAGPRACRALVLTPTRELAAQILDSFADYGRHLGLTRTVVFGGVGQGPQVKALAKGVDVLVATPGRLLDLVGQGHVRLDRLEVFVLDEADRMLDMGFIHDVRRIVRALPRRRQTLLFSATMPPEIARLADGLLTDPVKVEANPVASTAERVEQRVVFADKAGKRALLAELLADAAVERALVFTRTKHGANRVAEQLSRSGIAADALHGNKSQNARTRALDGFKSGVTRVLVATDIAARGIDVEGISHVVNYELPNVPESYVHRIGRTARAGRSGIAISFCDAEERAYLRDIEALIGTRIPVVAAHARPAAPAPSAGPAAVSRPGAERAGRPGRSRRRGTAPRSAPRGRRSADAAAISTAP